MGQVGGFNVLFIAGFGLIVREATASRRLYRQILDINFTEENDGYLHTEVLEGAKSFALWPLSQEAESCFGQNSWPDEIPPPQAWLEFDVDSVEAATAELESRGYRMLVKNKKEPWRQIVSRFLTPEGLLLGVTFTRRCGEASSALPLVEVTSREVVEVEPPRRLTACRPWCLGRGESLYRPMIGRVRSTAVLLLGDRNLGGDGAGKWRCD